VRYVTPTIPPTAAFGQPRAARRQVLIRLSAFEIHQPASVAEASDALRDLGEEATLYAGGTELLLAMKTAGLSYRHLVDVKAIPGLTGVQSLPDGGLRIGPAATHHQVESAPDVRARCPVLAETAARIANPRVRASGTVGGNLCFAEPHSDLATLLLCLGATCRVHNGETERALGLDELIVGPYETSLAPGDVLIGVEVPAQPPTRTSTYAKFQVHERPMLGLPA
jgi:carbon-monoxide dehydrogenase medium subunit